MSLLTIERSRSTFKVICFVALDYLSLAPMFRTRNTNGYRTLRHQDTLGHFGTYLTTLQYKCRDRGKAGTLRQDNSDETQLHW